MNKLVEELQGNLNKTVLLFTKKGYRYKGLLLSIDEKFIKIDDFKSGTQLIAVDSVEIANIVDGVQQ